MLLEIHGWDARERQWHAPAVIGHTLKGCGAVARRMRQSSGSWYGRMLADVPGEPRLSFTACVHDLGDCGLGILDIEGSEGGPLLFVLVVPEQRRGKNRPELAFEFLSFVRFLQGPEYQQTELALLEYIETALHTASNGHLVLSIESRPLDAEMQLLVSQQAERLAMAMVAKLVDSAQDLAAAAD